MSTGSETVTVPATLSPPNFFSPIKFPVDPRHISSRTQSLKDRSYSMTTTTTAKMSTQFGNRDSGSNQQQGAQPSSSNTIARSMSRYRRRAGSVTVNVDATQKINSDPPPPWEPPNRPPVPTIPSRLRTASITQKESDTHPPAASSNSPPRSQLRHTDSTQRHTSRRSMADHSHQSRPSTAKSVKSARSEESAWRRLASRDGRRNRLNSEEDDETARKEIARLEAENHRLLIEQKKKDLARLEVELANSHRTSTQSQPLKPKSPVIEKFVMLTKGRRNKDVLSPGLSPTSSNISIEPAKVSSTYIEPGGRGIVPQTDAPHSAINAGERVSAKQDFPSNWPPILT